VFVDTLLISIIFIMDFGQTLPFRAFFQRSKDKYLEDHLDHNLLSKGGMMSVYIEIKEARRFKEDLRIL